jgi:uncharacterized protein involved in exopolysaccharide biosynthesis
MEIREILRYFEIVRKWWWTIAVLVAVTIGTILAIALLTRAQYQATVTVQVSAPPPEEVPLFSQYGKQALYDEIEQTRKSFSELVWEGDVVYRVLEALPDVSMEGSELWEKMTIDMPESPQLIRLSVRAADPETAALLANTVVEAGLQRYGELRAQSTASTRQFIEREIEGTQTELEAAEAALIEFQIANKFTTLDGAIDNQYSLIRSLRTQSDLARVEGDMAKAQTLEELILEREIELQNLIGLSVRYNELLDRVERARNTHDYLLDRWSESRIKENQILDVGFIQVITPARPPQKPVSVISSKLIVLGTVASLLGGVLLAFLLEYLELSGVFQGLQRRSERSEIATLPTKAGEQVGS